MNILNYNFSLQGLSHKKGNIVCQDAGTIYINGVWHLAIAADGVGSCKHSDKASQMAVENACKLANAMFPINGTDEDYLSLMRMIMHYTANYIERSVSKQGEDIHDYETTFVAALYNGKDVYYANAGDSGIIALNTNGVYHVVTTKHNNEYGEVFPLSRRMFEVGKANFDAAAVICMTDGLLDWVTPNSLRDHKYRVSVPRMNIFVDQALFNEELDDEKMKEYSDLVQQMITELAERSETDDHIDKKYGELKDKNLKDDLTVAVLINTEALYDSIQWEEPKEKTTIEKFADTYKTLISLYPKDGKDMLLKHIKDCNANSSDEEIAEYVEKVIALAEKQSGEKAEMEEPSKQENNDAKKKTNKNWLKRKRKIKPRE